MNFRIGRASRDNIAAINDVIVRAKASWNYSEPYLRAALPLLRIDANYLETHFCLEVYRNEMLCGFAAVIFLNGEAYLDHLWIDPTMQKQGAGRIVLQEIQKMARTQEWSQLLTLPDPGAQGFYLRLGFVDTGARRPSRIAGGPEFAVYRWDVRET